MNLFTVVVSIEVAFEGYGIAVQSRRNALTMPKSPRRSEFAACNGWRYNALETDNVR
jgi:hypothetical protein